MDFREKGSFLKKRLVAFVIQIDRLSKGEYGKAHFRKWTHWFLLECMKQILNISISVHSCQLQY